MIAMENKVCGKEVGVAQGWTISSPISLAVDSLDSWVARGVAPETEVGGEERTWSTHSSKTNTVHCLKKKKTYRLVIGYRNFYLVNVLDAQSNLSVVSNMSKHHTSLTGCHWRTFTMGKQLNYNLARMYCVALATGKLCNQHDAPH